MKHFFLALFLSLSLFGAGEPATKEDIKELKESIQREMDKRFEQIDKRLELMQSNIDKRFEHIDKRFDDVSARFDDVNARFQETNSILSSLVNGIFGMVAAIFGLVGFMMWDRRTVSEKIKKETLEVVATFDEKLSKKADKDVFEKLIEVIEKVAKDNKEAQEILQRHRLKFA